ncbi:hypothetical protein VNI00_002231 [Paramarasmius palmivorus]|uniref:Transcription factor CBF/NF-Y/archaeal histone domain-containing protein n=1 Tax=Paramarasmius palmivorus TaxID=297713 RepID=A0AAW0E472_9AGAR
MASSSRPTPPHISRLSSSADIPTPDPKDEDEEMDEVISEEEEQVDELVSDESPSEAEDAKDEPYRPGEGKRKPGQTLLPQVRIENILQADGVTSNLALSKEGFFILSIATEEFIRRMAQGSLQEARRQQRNNITYQDMEMIPAPLPLSSALRLREMYKQSEQALLDFDPASAPPQPSQPAAIPKAMLNSAPPKPPKKSKPKTNGTEKPNGFNIHTLKVVPDPHVMQPPAEQTNSRTPGAGVLDARPWTHWSDPIVFETKRNTNSATSSAPKSGKAPHEAADTPKEKVAFAKHEPSAPGHHDEARGNVLDAKPEGHAGSASGLLDTRATGSNTGRTIYSQES